MRRGIVHIGMPRTGSTSLQVVLTHLRPHLPARGILYPEIKPRSVAWVSPNHQVLGETFEGRRPAHERAECLALLARTLAETRADTVILSYENFAQYHPRLGVPELLASILSAHGFAMEIAVVVKAPSEQLNSVYSHRAQLIHETRGFRAYAERAWPSGWFDYDALVEPWVAAAQGRITAIPLRDRRSDASLLERVLTGIGLFDRIGDLIGPADHGLVRNRSPGPIAVEASRRLRSLRVHRQTRVHTRAIGHFIDEHAWARGWDPVPFLGDAPDLLRLIDAHYGPTNDRFARRVWGAPWAAVARDATDREPNELAGRPIPAETEEAVAWLMDRTMAHHGFRRPPRWWCQAMNRLEDGATRLAPLVRTRGWRVT
ncbi:hypothetical protein [Methylobacterium sp. Leaf108]|uniref:hypothetical protein n=1 Tax=Methylobacterium sp. Leaf108 TaxID=1736256 RepID=UPI00070124FD|nr:hypothetical protein [Methylobacterium sp. Leaf108]KQP61311.1 hypothetical protein ASF39_01015 [Methylobacterium sp. Leaf108]